MGRETEVIGREYWEVMLSLLRACAMTSFSSTLTHMPVSRTLIASKKITLSYLDLNLCLNVNRWQTYSINNVGFALYYDEKLLSKRINRLVNTKDICIFLESFVQKWERKNVIVRQRLKPIKPVVCLRPGGKTTMVPDDSNVWKHNHSIRDIFYRLKTRLDHVWTLQECVVCINRIPI